MFSSLLLVLSLSSGTPQASAQLTPLAQTPAIEPKKVQDRRPVVKELLVELKKHVGKAGEEDDEALALVLVLRREYGESGPKDRASIVKELGKCLGVTRTLEATGAPDNTLYVPVAKTLGSMKSDATPVLAKWVGHKRHRKNLVLRRELIAALGRTGDLAATKILLDLLNDKSDSIVAWAGKALGEFGAAPQKVRKDIFERLIKILGTAKTLRDQNGNDILARKRFDAIDIPFRNTLARVSGASETTAEAWVKWWKENRRSSWESGKKKPL